jgi:hypothetical protein
MGSIFISYRRDDSRGDTGRLYDRLAERFGKKQLFRDVDQIAAGDRFPEVLDDKLRLCDVMLAVIGPTWLNIREGKRRRLDDPDDYVRKEIAAALERDSPIVPVLVGKASMPRSKDLPGALAPFGSFHAAELREDRFHADVDELITRIVALPKVLKHVAHGGLLMPRDRGLCATPDWLSAGVEPICPPLLVEWPVVDIIPGTTNRATGLSVDLEEHIDLMLQRMWYSKGALVPGICIREGPLDSFVCTVRVLGVLVSSVEDWANLEEAVGALEVQIRQHLPRLLGHPAVRRSGGYSRT